MRGEAGGVGVRVVVVSLLWAGSQLMGVGPAAALNHGGVPMGHSNVCDDAKTQIAIDWDPSSTQEYSCEGGPIVQSEERSNVSCEAQTKDPIHICYPTEIHYDTVPPTSGKHRPNWADFGEYLYVPPQRWLHDLEHGAIVLLYHPCADPHQVAVLRNIITGCIRKHVITPYKLLPRDTPLALLSWGCKLTMSHADPPAAWTFIRAHGKKDGPEGSLARPGRYRQSLITPAHIVSNYHDSVICPHALSQMMIAYPPLGPEPGKVTPNDLPLMPSLTPGGAPQRRSSILLQSLHRRQSLEKQTLQLQQAFQRLQRVYGQLSVSR